MLCVRGRICVLVWNWWFPLENEAKWLTGCSLPHSETVCALCTFHAPIHASNNERNKKWLTKKRKTRTKTCQFSKVVETPSQIDPFGTWCACFLICITMYNVRLPYNLHMVLNHSHLTQLFVDFTMPKIEINNHFMPEDIRIYANIAHYRFIYSIPHFAIIFF